MTKKMNWDRESQRARVERAESQRAPLDIVSAFRALSFYLQENDVDTRYVISIPDAWETMAQEKLIPYFTAHKKGSCKALRALKNAHWCRISRATAESVGIKECELCNPYSNY